MAKADLRRGVVSISAKGMRLIEAVAPSSEAIYADITRRYGARRLAELQDMLNALESRLAIWAGRAKASERKFAMMRGRQRIAGCIEFEHGARRFCVCALTE